METRVAVISIIVTEAEKVEMLNELLHEYSQYILGRMGVPYREKNLNIISIAIDAPMDKINSLSGRYKCEGDLRESLKNIPLKPKSRKGLAAEARCREACHVMRAFRALMI